ncbi:formin-binding protein HOF1 [Sugiyamaella lignohabitans]|uniref:Formin-binding protein HOF1 n=1 Tax=Sugiyamaella lignohabitans TaxID=796027 RepID=A0A170QXN7_9ASCO|nr:formin-binding protein HOF1 [Sugiyamaella lignohabitans]ANB15951.1 formin-binding protein HOF1 [Sugiyamaella lignohabitans]
MSELSFANNFWGKDDTGVENLLHRMHDSKQTFEEIQSFIKERIAIEEEYAKKMLALSRRALGSGEMGTTRHALDTIRINTESMSKSHSAAAQQFRKELSEPLDAFANSTRQRRKTVEGTVDKLLRAKTAQNAAVEKARTRYESDCNKLNGYHAQQSLLMGRELEKNNSRLERVQISIDSSKADYQGSLRVLAETIDRWNKEWKESCDKFQDLEEERITFLKSNLWAYANIVSTVCVSDDEGCENIRVSLEKCDAAKDIEIFVRAKGTGSEISDPPEFVNFLQGYSRESTTGQFKVANFRRRGSEDGSNLEVTMTQEEYEINSQNRNDVVSSRMSNASTSAPQRHQSYEYESDSRTTAVPSLSTSVTTSIPVLSPSLVESDRSAQTSPVMNTISPNSSVYSNSTSISSQSDIAMNEDDGQSTVKKRTWASPFGRKRSKKDLSKGWNSFSRSHSFNSSTDAKDNSSPSGFEFTNSASANDLTLTAKSGVGKQFVESSPLTPRPQHANRASVLGMGDNMFDLGVNPVAARNEGSSRSPSPNKKTLPRDDPLLAALERLKVSSASPSPGKDQRPHSLVAPEPAFTAGEMNATSSKYSQQTKQLFSYDDEHERQHRSQRPKSSIDLRSSQVPRATSPNSLMGGPYQITASPNTVRERPRSQYIENSSEFDVNSYRQHQRSKSQSPVKGSGEPNMLDYRRSASPNPYNQRRAQSPLPGNIRSASPVSSMRSYQPQDYSQGDQYHNYQQQPSQQPSQRRSRPRSKSSVDIRNMKRADAYPATTSDNRPVIRYSKAAYDYRAAIPEEVSFRKGDILLVTAMQEDGWWEVEVMANGRLGLAPSNFLVDV